MLLVEQPLTATATTHALAALMHLHAARLPARLDVAGNLSSLWAQDRSQWDVEMIQEGRRLLDLSATGPLLTEYHLEAAIAYVHATAPTAADTDWRQIVLLYDRLLALRPSPVIALNRAIALAQCDGPARGLEEIRTIAQVDRLRAYPFYFAALGELELRSGNAAAAAGHFQSALALARNPTEQRFFERRLQECATVAG
jgi:RNA polymerase sigma-70 factor (ECF subfamily)